MITGNGQQFADMLSWHATAQMHVGAVGAGHGTAGPECNGEVQNSCYVVPGDGLCLPHMCENDPNPGVKARRSHSHQNGLPAPTQVPTPRPPRHPLDVVECRLQPPPLDAHEVGQHQGHTAGLALAAVHQHAAARRVAGLWGFGRGNGCQDIPYQSSCLTLARSERRALLLLLLS